MAAVFGPSSNLIVKLVLIVAALGLLLLYFGPWIFPRIDYATGAQWVRNQPVPFSHKHHVQGDGIDCRYCHKTVETSANAGYPSAYTCMTCHSQIWSNARMLAPVRLSLAENVPLKWRRLNRLPDYVFFDHSIHIAKGVGCTTCHGDVTLMPMVWRGATLSMSWCINCHRDPAPELRPRNEVFNPNWHRTAKTPTPKTLMAEYHILPPSRLIDCYVCHR